MRVDFTFDKNSVEADGYTLEDIYRIIKKEFAAKNLPCVSDKEVLSFGGTGNKNDFSYMLVTIDKITRFEWFLNYTTSCIWRRDEHKWEDILRQVKEEKQAMRA